jgi:hypothetical protein
MVLQQPLNAHPVAVEVLLIRLKHHDDIPVGSVALLPVSDQVGDESRRIKFVVNRSASVEIAVSFHEFERICGPIFAARGNDVEVGEEERAFACRFHATEQQDFLCAERAKNLNIGSAETCCAQALRHRISGL